jgi:hypothetical protein
MVQICSRHTVVRFYATGLSHRREAAVRQAAPRLYQLKYFDVDGRAGMPVVCAQIIPEISICEYRPARLHEAIFAARK